MARYVGLIFLVLFGSFMFLGVSPPVHADTFGQAYTSCRTQLDYIESVYGSTYVDYKCTVNSAEHRYELHATRVYDDLTQRFGLFPFFSDVCSPGSVSPVTIRGWTSGLPGPTYSNIGSCQCVTFNQLSFPDYQAIVAQCQQTGNQYGDYSGQDGVPTSPPPITDNPPPPCDGGSCYDPGTNQFCALDGSGKQVCVAGPNQQPPDKGKTPQYCGIGDGVAVCAGTPDSPKPQGQFTDPTGTTHVFTPDSSGSGSWTTVVNVYNTTGQGNNADPGDGSSSTGSTGNSGNNGSEGAADGAGQCPDGSTPSAGGCGAGYADRGCDAPPTCSGDPLLCAGIKEQHATRCAQAKRAGDLSDVTKASAMMDAQGLPSLDGGPSEGDWYQTVDLGGDGSGGGGVLDDSGWGYDRECPLEPKTFALMGQSVTIDYSTACGALNIGGILIMIAAYLAAARILMIGK